VTRAIRLIKACDGFRENLDLAAGRRQFCTIGIVAERTKLAAIVGRLRQDQAVAAPERVEAWGL
jgi:hypothetical protein